MLKTAKKHNVNFAPLKLTKTLQQQMPAWNHIGAPPKMYRKTKDSCLQNTHKIITIEELTTLTYQLNIPGRHHARKNCACDECKRDRTSGCKNPHKCANTADEILRKLPPKFQPKMPPTKDNLTLTHRRKEKNARARAGEQDKITFNPSITENNLSECFRIFANRLNLTCTPAYQLGLPPIRENTSETPINAYMDGSCKHNGKANAICGSGIWIAENHPLNKAIKYPAKNNQT
ncbi:hypothetical protein DFJ58DRAFT_856750, partial [Suillus subalutaceus]|uniref:uncharacterized protein n=1 Tax=Suillus subalutaceus TaxID=48586 RepID=UPI001B863E34